MRGWLQIDAWDPVASAAVALQATNEDDVATCMATGGPWWPMVAKMPVLRYDLFDGAFGDQISAPSSSLTMQVEAWPNFARYALTDARIRLWLDLSAAPIFDGRITAQPVIAKGQATIQFAADDRWLDTPLLATYAGTTGVEGPASLKGAAKPLALGAPRYVAGKLIDSVNSVFQVSAYGAVQGFDAALERLARFGNPIADYSSYAALVAATIPAGQWATATAVGMARFGAPPNGQISFLVRGDAAGADGWARKPGQLIRRIAQLSGGTGKIDDASLNALDTARPYNLSVYVDQQTTARTLIQSIAASVNAVAQVSWTGKLFVVPVGLGTATITLMADGSALPPVRSVEQKELAPPFKRVSIGAERTWTVHALADIAFADPLVDRGAYAADAYYRPGNIVQYGSVSWRYLASAASGSGHAPPDPPAKSNAYWTVLSGTSWATIADTDPTRPKPQDGATVGAPAGTNVGGVPAQDVANAVKDSSGNVVPARDQIAAARAALEQSIAQAQSDIATAQALLASINSSVSGLVTTSIPDLTQRITAAEGVNTSQAQLLTTYGTQISTVTSQASTTAGNLATLIQTAQAGNYNLLTNGGFENGLDRWAIGGGSWTVGTALVGRHVFASGPAASVHLFSEVISAIPGKSYTLSARMLARGTTNVRMDVLWYDASGQALTPIPYAAPNRVSLEFDTPGNREGSVFTAVAPAGTASMRVRLIGENLSAGGAVGFQQVKLEIGTRATPYTSEAAVTQTYTAISTATDQVAQLSNTIGTVSASITSLQTANTTLQGDMATVKTQLVAGSPNLLGNGGFEDGLRAWWQAIGAWRAQSGNIWGSYAEWDGVSALPSGERAVVLEHNPILFDPGQNFSFTVDANAYNAAGNAYCRLEVWFYSDQAMTQQIGVNFAGPAVGALQFSNASGANRKALAVTGVSPSTTGAMWVRCRVIFGNMTMDGKSGAAVRQAKFERSSAPTAFTNETSLLQTYQSISSINGTTSLLQTQINTQGASISTLQSSTTSLQGSVASITQRLVAGNPNLAPNGSGEAGYTQGWHDVVGSWWAQSGQDTWGAYFYWSGQGATADGERLVILDSGLIKLEQGAAVVLSGDPNVWNSANNAYCRFELIFYSASDQTNELGHFWGPNVTQPSFWNAAGVNRQNMALYATSPTGTAWCRIRFVACNMSNAGGCGAAVRQIKLERGTQLTTYSSEASLYLSYQALSTVSQQYASLSSTVSTQGVTISSQQTAITTLNNNVATVFGQWVLDIDANGRVAGIRLANNGSTSSLRFRADLITFETPSGGYRTEYSNGGWRTYNASNVIVYEDGVYS